MAVVQELGEAVGDEAVIHRGGEELLLRVPRQIGPYLQRGASEEGRELAFVHVL